MMSMSAMSAGRCAAAAALLTLAALGSVMADEAPGDCFGIDFNQQHPVAIGKITAAKPRVYFVKNASDSAACPADTDAIARFRQWLGELGGANAAARS